MDAWKCDRCEVVMSRQRTQRWYVLKREGPTIVGEELGPRHFCSAECLAGWSTERVDEVDDGLRALVFEKPVLSTVRRQP